MKWKLEVWDIDRIKPQPWNPRIITEEQRAQLRKSIERYGRAEPLVVNTDGTLIGGHQRLGILKEMGVKEVEVMVPEKKLNNKQVRELNLRLNKNTGDWDFTLLTQEFEKYELLDVGFTLEEVYFSDVKTDEEDEDNDAERVQLLEVVPPETPRVKEHFYISAKSFAAYQQLKELLEKEKITVETILELLENKKKYE